MRPFAYAGLFLGVIFSTRERGIESEASLSENWAGRGPPGAYNAACPPISPPPPKPTFSVSPGGTGGTLPKRATSWRCRRPEVLRAGEHRVIEDVEIFNTHLELSAGRTVGPKTLCMMNYAPRRSCGPSRLGNDRSEKSRLARGAKLRSIAVRVRVRKFGAWTVAVYVPGFGPAKVLRGGVDPRGRTPVTWWRSSTLALRTTRPLGSLIKPLSSADWPNNERNGAARAWPILAGCRFARSNEALESRGLVPDLVGKLDGRLAVYSRQTHHPGRDPAAPERKFALVFLRRINDLHSLGHEGRSPSAGLLDH
jgi:hypothetical protein